MKSTKVFKRNPLSYFGWLGVFGLIGLAMGATWTYPFLLFFFFFTYTNMVADELFWNQVRRAGLKAFVAYLVFHALGFLFMMLRATFLYGFSPDKDMQKTETGYLITERYMGQMMLGDIIMVLGWIITLCTFFFALMYDRRQEKRFAEEEAC